jgi:hypothetical protein
MSSNIGKQTSNLRQTGLYFAGTLHLDLRIFFKKALSKDGMTLETRCNCKHFILCHAAYRSSETYVSLTFRWITIPWLQEHLDQWAQQRNSFRPKRHKHKFLPHGPPVHIRTRPQDFEALDFKVKLELYDHHYYLLLPTGWCFPPVGQ